MLSGKDGSLVSPVLENQYDVIHGSWPNDYNEIVIVVDKNNELDDIVLYALGLVSEGEIEDLDKKELIDRKHRMNLFKLELMPSFKPVI